MLSEKMIKELNKQLNFEMLSAHYYVAMAAYAAEEEYDGMAHFFQMQSKEETFHAMKFFDFIVEVDGRVEVDAISKPDKDYNSLLDLFEKALKHEEEVTKRINKLMDLAREEKSYVTINFLDWFIEEQLEEETSMKTIITKLKRFDGNQAGLYMLDKELGAREE